MQERTVFRSTSERVAPSGSERRVAVRCLCDQEALSRPDVVPPSLVWEGRVRDLAAGGIGLWFDRPFPPETTLEVEIQGRPTLLPLLAKVVHVIPHEEGWIHGCEFLEPLTPEQLEPLL